jgi:hypothetical protein
MFRFGLMAFLAFRYNNFDLNNIVLTQVVLAVIRRLLSQIYPSIYGVNITIGLLSKGQNVS